MASITEFIKQVLTTLESFPKLLEQAKVVYKMVKNVLPVLKAFGQTFDAPQIEVLIEPLEKTLLFFEKVLTVFGVKLDEEVVSGQSNDDILPNLVRQYNDIEASDVLDV